MTYGRGGGGGMAGGGSEVVERPRGVLLNASDFAVSMGGVLDEVVGRVDAGEDGPAGDVGLGCILHVCPPLLFCDRGAGPLGGAPAGGCMSGRVWVGG